MFHLLGRLLGVSVVTAVTVGLLAGTAAAGGTLGIRLLEGPADRADDPRAHIYIIDHVSPGEVIERRIGVSNTTDRDLPVELYPAAAGLVGGQWTTAPGREANELTSWITVNPSEVTVPPGTESQATVRIVVDPAASEGEHYAVVWAQPPAGGSGGVGVVNRVGIRVYLSVGPGGEPPTDFTIDALTAERNVDGHPTVTAAVTNIGGRAIDLNGELTLEEGPGGTHAGPFSVERGTTLAPGEQGDVRVVLDPDLPSGPWTATIVLRSGTTERTAQARIDFPDGPGTSTEPVPTEESAPGGVLPFIALLLLLIVIIVWILVVARERRRDQLRQRPEPSRAAHNSPDDVPRIPAGIT